MSNGRSGHENGVDVPTVGGILQPFGKLRAADPLVVRERGRCGKPSAIAAHHFVDDQHSRVRRMLGDDVARKERALFGRGPGAERLPDRYHVIVDGLGQARPPSAGSRCERRYDARSAAVPLVSSPPIVWRTSTRSRLSCSAATCNGFCPGWTRPRFTQSSTLVSLTRLLPIGLPPNACSRPASRSHLVGHFDRSSGEQARIPVEIGDDPNVGGDLGVSLDQSADGGGEAGRKAARGEHCYGGNWHELALPISRGDGQTSS